MKTYNWEYEVKIYLAFQSHSVPCGYKTDLSEVVFIRSSKD